LGRTVDELLNGSPSHNPISAIELAEWEALEQVRLWEMEKQQKSKIDNLKVTRNLARSFGLYF
jgi:hypothetical protein